MHARVVVDGTRLWLLVDFDEIVSDFIEQLGVSLEVIVQLLQRGGELAQIGGGRGQRRLRALTSLGRRRGHVQRRRGTTHGEMMARRRRQLVRRS